MYNDAWFEAQFKSLQNNVAGYNKTAATVVRIKKPLPMCLQEGILAIEAEFFPTMRTSLLSTYHIEHNF